MDAGSWACIGALKSFLTRGRLEETGKATGDFTHATRRGRRIYIYIYTYVYTPISTHLTKEVGITYNHMTKRVWSSDHGFRKRGICSCLFGRELVCNFSVCNWL